MVVQLDQQLLDILACPSEDHAPLVVGTPGDPDADFLTCTSCHRAFPVRDGIPVLLLDEAVELSAAGTPAGTPGPSGTSGPAPAVDPTPRSQPRPGSGTPGEGSSAG
ncbi:Trm112 family protein [Goodfellowiella coeruleoviolacea]|uniref:UPF0434 protein LX83_004823 n=1 Tax=Goodfellowiella coeruleoviolacea TaxID=334858 RepID=A0AAE3GIJ0_9PSEU|nr:Trm112 family protein [Goodfellowiella coeruleoviolacea]MCP2167949.1 putative conserved protein YbaR, Trm112 family [Goodfellowiella coeruleoviolacea]